MPPETGAGRSFRPPASGPDFPELETGAANERRAAVAFLRGKVRRYRDASDTVSTTLGGGCRAAVAAILDALASQIEAGAHRPEDGADA